MVEFFHLKGCKVFYLKTGPNFKLVRLFSVYCFFFNLQGDADIFFPTDFWLLERMDHFCSGWLKLDKGKSSQQGKKRRTITVSFSLLCINSSFYEKRCIG